MRFAVLWPLLSLMLASPAAQASGACTCALEVRLEAVGATRVEVEVTRSRCAGSGCCARRGDRFSLQVTRGEPATVLEDHEGGGDLLSPASAYLSGAAQGHEFSAMYSCSDGESGARSLWVAQGQDA